MSWSPYCLASTEGMAWFWCRFRGILRERRTKQPRTRRFRTGPSSKPPRWRLFAGSMTLSHLYKRRPCLKDSLLKTFRDSAGRCLLTHSARTELPVAQNKLPFGKLFFALLLTVDGYLRFLENRRSGRVLGSSPSDDNEWIRHFQRIGRERQADWSNVLLTEVGALTQLHQADVIVDRLSAVFRMRHERLDGDVLNWTRANIFFFILIPYTIFLCQRVPLAKPDGFSEITRWFEWSGMNHRWNLQLFVSRQLDEAMCGCKYVEFWKQRRDERWLMMIADAGTTSL